MGEPIKRIVIAGGGTAGWLSAAYLNRALRGQVDIVLVESSDVDPVGVGEATVPSLPTTMRFLGFRDEEWMPEAQATYKTAIKFVDWSPSVRPFYYHAFAPRPEPKVNPYEAPYFVELGNGFSPLHYALKRRLDGDTRELSDIIFGAPSACERRKSPVHPENPEQGLRTAYHLDAGLLAGFLRKTALSRGVRHVLGHIEHVQLDERGFISGLTLRDGQTLTGDLFIDCTGFRSLLLNQALEEPFESDGRYLLCDAAVALPSKNDPEREGINPFTTATALEHGWVWDVPLYHRNGCGYVYSSQFLGADAAETRLRRFLGPRCGTSRANHIKMRVGRSQRMWVKNCVGIGLSACFLEPLESSGIFMIEYGLANLVTFFPSLAFEPSKISGYNEMMHRGYVENRDFIVLHYAINKRDDTEFWRLVRQPEAIPDSLRDKLEFYRHSLPVVDPSTFSIFRSMSYAQILDGNGELPRSSLSLLDNHLGYDAGETFLRAQAHKNERLLAELWDHRSHLQHMYDRARPVAKPTAQPDHPHVTTLD